MEASIIKYLRSVQRVAASKGGNRMRRAPTKFDFMLAKGLIEQGRQGYSLTYRAECFLILVRNYEDRFECRPSDKMLETLLAEACRLA